MRARLQKMLPGLADLALLPILLKIGFLLQPGDRPEAAMLMLAVAILACLLISGSGDGYTRSGLLSILVIAAVYAWYWRRPGDALPLLVWFGMIHLWRYVLWPPEKDASWLAAAWPALAPVFNPVITPVGRILRSPAMKHVQVGGVLVIALVLMRPYLTRGLVGAGDAYWYANTLADYVMQLRAGIFPVWTAQTEYSFYGSIFPLRLAPYLQHLAGVIDLVTARQLPPHAIANGAMVLSLTAGMLVMQACLGRIIPRRPWTAAGLALCYGLCPGVLGLAYALDLFMSFSTLPFLPLVFLGVVRSFERNDLGPRLLMAGGLAATWLAHPPIGLWCGIVVGATQVVRVWLQASWRQAWRSDLFGAVTFFLLTGYSFVSVQSLGPMAGGSAKAHYLFVKQFFASSWLPLDLTSRLGGLQLGYGLAALGLVAAVLARGPEQRMARLLLGCAAGLLILLTPIPFLTEFLWRIMPQFVLDLTNNWPMQRLLVLLAVCLLFGIAAGFAAVSECSRAGRLLNALLAGALVWGGLEAVKFIRLADYLDGNWTKTEIAFRPENCYITYAGLGGPPVVPRYFSNGVTDPVLEHRFLAPDSKEIIHNAVDAIRPGFGPGGSGGPRRLTQRFTGELDEDRRFLNLTPRFTLAPGKHYLLLLEFLEKDYTGQLFMDGPGFTRMYLLPAAGEKRAFGANPGNARWLSLWQTTDRPEEVRLRWLPTGSARPESYVPFANYEWVEYDPAKLDVVVESWLPYRAAVNAPAPSYLETPRLFFPGYRAVVDGHPAPVERSPDGFVMVRLEPGRHVLELRHVPPWSVRAAYWLGLASWLGFAVFSVRTFRRQPARPRAS